MTKAKKEEKQKSNGMSFWEHLEEMRSRLVRSIIAVVLFSILAFVNKKLIFDKIILAPKSSDFITNRFLCKISDTLCGIREWLCIKALCIENLDLSIQNLNLSGQFMTHMYVSIAAGALIAMPYLIWQIWSFIKPAMYDNEKKYSGGAVFVISLLFAIGVLFSYFLIVPLTLNFLGTYHVSGDVKNIIALNSYISTVVSLSFGVGVIFELPVFVFFLTKVGILTPDFMKKNRKYMLIVILILSAIITPADIFSQLMVAFPLLILYEVSIKISQRVYRKNNQKLVKSE